MRSDRTNRSPCAARADANDIQAVTQVNAGSDLTANHIIQSARVICGASGNSALVTIDASDASGKSMDESSSIALAGSFTSRVPSGASVLSSSNLSASGGSSANGSTQDGGTLGGSAAVPEPTTLLLAMLGLTALGCLPRRKRK